MDGSERADALFHALADPTRRDILAVVLQDAHSVSDLARRYPISFAAVHNWPEPRASYVPRWPSVSAMASRPPGLW
jgi:hypothetical protein